MNENPVSTRFACGKAVRAIQAAVVPVVAQVGSVLDGRPIASDSGRIHSRLLTGTYPRSAGHQPGMSSGSQCRRPGSTSRYSRER